MPAVIWMYPANVQPTVLPIEEEFETTKKQLAELEWVPVTRTHDKLKITLNSKFVIAIHPASTR